jgi:hypothetical protein
MVVIMPSVLRMIVLRVIMMGAMPVMNLGGRWKRVAVLVHWMPPLPMGHWQKGTAWSHDLGAAPWILLGEGVVTVVGGVGFS